MNARTMTASRAKAPAPLPVSFARRPARIVAPDLLGRLLVRTWDDGYRTVLRIVETEAYLGAPDRASHAFDGRRTARNASLYLPGGHWYVYFIYGMHHCLNLVTGTADNGDAVLIRACEVVEGGDRLVPPPPPRRPRAAPRPLAAPRSLTNGPGKLCRALNIGRNFDRLPMHDPALFLARGRPVPAARIAVGPRIGIAYAAEAALWPLRFAVRGHPDLSKPI
jgi:DNA-3-methyladenine glycosylase